MMSMKTKNRDYKISKNETLRAIRTDHTAGSCGYIYTINRDSVLITQDTFSLKNIIEELNRDTSIKNLMVECSFPDEMQELAKVSKHLTPKLLFGQLESLCREDIKIYINHIKPLHLNKIIEQIEENRGKWDVNVVKDGDYINF